jgi:hypothetical protein
MMGAVTNTGDAIVILATAVCAGALNVNSE